MSEERPSHWSIQRDHLVQVVSDMIRALVDNEGAVRVTAINGDQCTIIEVRVNAPDYPKVVGRNGRYITALNVLVGAAGGKLRRRIVLSLVESDGRRSKHPHWRRQGEDDFSAAWREPK